MDVKEIVEPEGKLTLPPPPGSIVAIAVKGNGKSKSVVSWTLEKFVHEGITLFKLLHVCPRITAVPTPSKLCFDGIIILQKKKQLLPKQLFLLIYPSI